MCKYNIDSFQCLLSKLFIILLLCHSDKNGNFLPKTDNAQTIGSRTKRFSRIYLASTIDVSGSELIISPSASAAAGNSFNVVLSGSMIPADSDNDSFGSEEAPFKDLFNEMMEFIDDVVDPLGSRKQIDHLQNMVKNISASSIVNSNISDIVLPRYVISRVSRL